MIAGFRRGVASNASGDCRYGYIIVKGTFFFDIMNSNNKKGLAKRSKVAVRRGFVSEMLIAVAI